MMMNRRAFSAALLTGAAASLISTRGMAANSTPVNARNVVLVHGLFADGSCWSEVIARLQAAGLNVTAVQHPLTTLPEAVASAQRVLARQDGPTVLVGHSFSGMIVTEAGVHPNVSALVYVAARAPDAGEDYTALAKTFPTPPATAGIKAKRRRRVRISKSHKPSILVQGKLGMDSGYQGPRSQKRVELPKLFVVGLRQLTNPEPRSTISTLCGI